MAERERNYNLDLIKLLACIFVILSHSIHRDFSALNSVLYHCCGFAVPCFMMASGYMLLKKDSVTAGYIVKKVLGILQLTAIWNAIVYLGILAVNYLMGNGFTGVSLVEYIRMICLCLVQQGVLWQFWYFGALILVYLCLPLLLYIKKKGFLLQAWLVLLAISLTIQLISTIRGASLQENLFQTFRLWSWLQYTCLGGLMPEFLEKVKVKFSFKLHSILLAITTVIMLIYKDVSALYILHTTKNEFYMDGIIMIAWVFLLFSFLSRCKLSQRVVKVVQAGVSLSMGVYIVHPLIIDVITHFVQIETVPASLLFFLVVTVSSFIGVWLVKKVPFAQWLFRM